MLGVWLYNVNMIRGVIYVMLLSVIGIGGIWSAQAATFDSSNFSINGNLGDSVAGGQSSTNYAMTSAGGESIAGGASSLSYQLAQGYTPQLNDSDNALQLSVQPNGLVGYWPLENSAGNATAFDESLNTNNGTYATGSNSTTGKVGMAWNDSVGTQYVSIPNTASQSLGTKMTISAWVRNSGSVAQPAILSKWQYNPSAGSWAFQTTPGATDLRMFVKAAGTDDGVNYVDSTNAAMQPDTWYFVTMVYDGTLSNADRVKLYLNGTQLTTVTNGTIPTTLTASTDEMRIGDFPGLNRYWSGAIDEVKLYSRALSQAEIAAEYGASNAGVAAGVALGNGLTPGQSQSALLDAVVLSSTGSYNLSINQSGNLTNGGDTISGVSGSIASPATWQEGTTKGLGFTLYDTNATALPGAWLSGSAYAPIPSTSTTFYSRSGTPSSKDVINMRLRLDVPTEQAVGTYSNQAIVTGTVIP